MLVMELNWDGGMGVLAFSQGASMGQDGES